MFAFAAGFRRIKRIQINHLYSNVVDYDDHDEDDAIRPTPAGGAQRALL